MPDWTDEQLVEMALRDKRNNSEAQQRFNEEETRKRIRIPDEFFSGNSLEHDLAADDPGIRYAVEQLAGQGHVVSLPSTRKTGKTTLLANLAWAGADGEPFLGKFQTHLDGNVGIWNLEMERLDYRDVFWPMRIQNPGKIRMAHLRGWSVPFLEPYPMDQVYRWLGENQVRWWFLDPWKNVCSANGVSINDNAGVQRLVEKIQEIQARAGLTLVVIPMHTPQAQQAEGEERAKGAGEFEDGADVMWRYVKASPGRSSPRVLTVEGRGRGTGLDETAIDYDPETGRLTLGNGNRHEARADALMHRASEVISYLCLASGPPNTSQVTAHMGGNKQAAGNALHRAASAGLVESQVVGKSVLWRSVPSVPELMGTDGTM